MNFFHIFLLKLVIDFFFFVNRKRFFNVVCFLWVFFFVFLSVFNLLVFFRCFWSNLVLIFWKFFLFNSFFFFNLFVVWSCFVIFWRYICNLLIFFFVFCFIFFVLSLRRGFKICLLVNISLFSIVRNVYWIFCFVIDGCV